MSCFKYAINKLYKRNKIYTILYLLFSFITLITSVLELILTQNLINYFTYYSDGTVGKIMHLIIALVIILYVGGLLNSIRGVSLSHLVEIGLYEDENIILSKSCNLSIINLDSPEIKDLRNKAKRTNLFDIVNCYVEFSVALLKIVIYSLIIIYYKCYLLLPVIILVIIVKSWLQKKYGNRIEELDRKQMTSNRVIEYLYNLLVNRETMQEIKVTKNIDYLNDKRKDIYATNYKERIKIVKENEIKLFGIDSVVTFCNIISLCILVILCSYHNIEAGVYVLLMQILTQLYSIIPAVSNGYGRSKVIKLQFEEYIKYLNLDDYQFAENTGRSEAGEALGVKLNNISFSYPNAEKKALYNVNMHIKPGERIAIVGENGSGKSTLVKMILGIYSPDDGTVNWYQNGNISEKCDNSKLKAVFQDFIKLLRTIRENVAMGNIETINNDEMIKNSIIIAGNPDLAEDIDQYIGPEFGGTDLSGGQWQKLSIARAYMKRAKLAAFDEATSALDALAELNQYQAFFKQGEKITSIIVTHRLSITKMVDKIYVIDNGQITECGSHNELYNKNGKYKEMYDAQATFYV